MNYNGGDFALDTRFDGDALICNKLFLGGHIFKLTGFADALTFSDNNFYVADTVVGSVSNYQFQFTDAAALNVADGDTIAIAQLGTDTVNYSLDLKSLNSTTPWSFAQRTAGIYTYTSAPQNYIRNDTATYSYNATTAAGEAKTLTLNIGAGLALKDLTNDKEIGDNKLKVPYIYSAASFVQ